MTVSVKDWPDSPLDAVDTAFAALTCDPHPLSLDLATLDRDTGLQAGVLALPALRRWLLEHPHAYTVRDLVWRELIRRARLDGPAWMIAAVGMALPALRRYAGRLRTGWAGDPQDLDAEILTGFLAALRDRVDLARPAPYAALCAAAWRAGYRLRQRERAEAIPVAEVGMLLGPYPPHRLYGHPDVLVRRAVTLGIVDPDDEQPYIDLRLGRRAIEPIAANLGIGVDTLRRRMQRIDRRLVDALTAGLLTGVVSPRVREQLAGQARQRQRIRARRAAAGPPALMSGPAA